MVVEKPKPKCEYDPKLQTVVHRFEIGLTTCNCGSMSIDKQKTFGGWRRLPNDNKKDKK
jgi:hypothetical protein